MCFSQNAVVVKAQLETIILRIPYFNTTLNFRKSLQIFLALRLLNTVMLVFSQFMLTLNINAKWFKSVTVNLAMKESCDGSLSWWCENLLNCLQLA